MTPSLIKSVEITIPILVLNGQVQFLVVPIQLAKVENAWLLARMNVFMEARDVMTQIDIKFAEIMILTLVLNGLAQFLVVAELPVKAENVF